MNHQLQTLNYALHAGTFAGLDDEPPEPLTDDEAANPVGAFFEKSAFEAAGGPKDFRTSGDALAKRAAENRMGICGPYGSALAKREETTLHVDGDTLAKRADDDVERDLSKRSTTRGTIRMEKTVIDGQNWILGWNFEGENVYSSPLEDYEQMHK